MNNIEVSTIAAIMTTMEAQSSLNSTVSGITGGNLATLDKDQLIHMVLSLQQTISKLHEDFQKVNNLRFYHLERRLNMSEQYSRRDSLEITGIPRDVEHDQLEDEVIEIFKDAKVSLNRQPLKKTDIQATHRIGKKGVVICKVVNRKFIRKALVNHVLLYICTEDLKKT